ncbi:MAG TPA: hypothetical protein VFU73_12445 [Actinocrinis sp.]|nr:hypothetical protein [Actinocrinis sp.]
MPSDAEPKPQPGRRRAAADGPGPDTRARAFSQTTESWGARPGKGRSGALRELAGCGLLARTAAADPSGRAALEADLYELAWPVVFHRLTRAVEAARGHHACARSVASLASDCLDRFQDDVAAVVEYTLRHANVPIHNLEAWITSRLTAATVDGHRRERGRRGAPQRPRVPKWLAAELGGDPWLVRLALAVLTWVGVPATAGAQLWPLESWRASRAAALGDWADAEQAGIERDVETVLAAMRTREAWYLKFVERPLGAKQAPVYAGPPAGAEPADEAPALALVAPHEGDEGRLARLAECAVDELARRLAAGEEPRACVVDVVRHVFAQPDPAWGIDRPPHDDPAHEERVSALLDDTAEIDRIVAAVLDIVAALPVS